MAKHRQTRRLRLGGTRGVLLSPREAAALIACLLGLLAAWLFYSTTGSQAAAANESSYVPGMAAATAPAAPGSAVPGSPAGKTAALDSAQQGLRPAASAPEHLSYPAAGMEVGVQVLQQAAAEAESRTIAPPETMSGYWLASFGVPGSGSENTTYIIGHSWEGVDSPFNHLSSSASRGDEFVLTTATGTLRYRVDDVSTYTKSTLKDSAVWDVVPNRVVLISCYTSDPWGKNVVVVASPAGTP